MGREQRSRRHLSPGTICYLCGTEIVATEPWNRDHLPPQRMYGKSVREQFNPNLNWLPTHNGCNSSYRSDEEYTVTALVGHVQTPTARAVFSDIQRGATMGHAQGLLKTIVGQFGQVELAGGSVAFHYDVDRVGRIAWKLVRGLYFRDVNRVLPEDVPKRLILISPDENQHVATKYPWFQVVRNTQSLGEHGAVFDYKWVGIVPEKCKRGHVLAMLLWDKLMLLTVFHDPGCMCADCAPTVPEDCA